MAAVTTLSFDSVHGVAEAALCNKALARVGAELILDTVEQTKAARACRAVYAPARDELLRLFPFNFSVRSRTVSRDTTYLFEKGPYSYAWKANDWASFTGTCVSSATITAVAGITPTDAMVGEEISGTNIAEGSRVIDTTATTIVMDRPSTGTASGFFIRIPYVRILGIDNASGTRDESLHEIAGSGDERRILTDAFYSAGLPVKYIERVINPALFDVLFYEALVAKIALKIAPAMTQNMQIVGLLMSQSKAAEREAAIASSQELVIDEVDDYWTKR